MDVGEKDEKYKVKILELCRIGFNLLKLPGVGLSLFLT